MRRRTTAKTNRATGVKHNPPWIVTSVRPLADYRLRVDFVDGTSGEVDLSRMVNGANPGVFRPLREPAFFARVEVCHGAVTWPGELDLAPDAMYEELRAHGRWVVPEFPAVTADSP